LDPAPHRGGRELDDQPVLFARSLFKRYSRDAPWVLRGVSLQIAQGVMTAIVGPNGAGKSTLIRTWMGFERPSAGSVQVGGMDPWKDRAAALRKVGYVSQASRFYRSLTVADHIEYAESLRPGFDAAFARDRLRVLEISLGARATQLSGGQQSQLSLALALATTAPILVLDEPLASLDPLARRDFMRVLMEIKRTTRRTIVLSSHVVRDVEDACDRVILLIDGDTVLDLEVSEVVETHYVTDSVVADPPDKVVARLPTLAGGSRALIRGKRDSSRPKADLEDIVMGYLAAARNQSTSSEHRHHP
jgi:ABC-2 type transport system ATP-binding protein